MKYISLFSGVEAATVAWHDMGWDPVVFAEFDEFPSMVLKHHYPNVKNIGDVMKHEWKQYKGKADVIVGGSPCQSFSVAGQRLGMDDPRGNLALHYLRIVREVQPKWFVFENVPGLLSSNGGDDFATFLGEVAKCGYGFAYRILDAQHFGVPQRRRRVFVVGCADGDWRSAAAVLFEQESLCGNFAPSKAKGKNSSLFPQGSLGETSEESERGRGIIHTTIATGLVSKGNGEAWEIPERHMALTSGGGQAGQGYAAVRQTSLAPSLTASNNPSRSPQSSEVTEQVAAVFNATSVVRRMTPVECERLQGFPDNYTQIAWKGKPAEQCPDAPRYKAMGNSMAVPVMKWIGMRIDAVDSIRNTVEREKSKTTRQTELW